MHELSIAENIISIVTEYAEKEKAGRILEVSVDIGAVSGVIPDALNFAWEFATGGTIAEEAILKIRLIEPRAVCRNCHNEFSLDGNYSCPICNIADFDIIMGKELKVNSIKIE
jgi:hydrogenase nickel incorporation protein HypA/HybF